MASACSGAVAAGLHTPSHCREETGLQPASRVGCDDSTIELSPLLLWGEGSAFVCWCHREETGDSCCWRSPDGLSVPLSPQTSLGVLKPSEPRRRQNDSVHMDSTQGTNMLQFIEGFHISSCTGSKGEESCLDLCPTHGWEQCPGEDKELSAPVSGGLALLPKNPQNLFLPLCMCQERSVRRCTEWEMALKGRGCTRKVGLVLQSHAKQIPVPIHLPIPKRGYMPCSMMRTFLSMVYIRLKTERKPSGFTS